MAASEHKTEGLNPYYKIPKSLAGPLTIEIDEFSRYVIEKGDSEALNLFDDKVKASLGQRYVMVAFIKEGIAHLRAIPGFEFVADVKQREQLREKARKFFDSEKIKCTLDDIAFPDHAIWTGVVHEQLIKNIKDKERKICEGAEIVAFSMFKRRNKLEWLNRSVKNVEVFDPDPLATACYMYEKEVKLPVKFDLFYHLTRSMPEEFFVKLTDAATEEIYKEERVPLALSFLDICINFKYEATWERIRKLFRENHAEACKQIQDMLIRNLHMFLDKQCSLDDIGRSEDIIINGLKAAEKHGIPIDLDLIPPEAIVQQDALTKAKENKSFYQFLNDFQLRQLFYAAQRNNNYSLVQKKLKEAMPEDVTNIINQAIQFALTQKNYDIVNAVYESASEVQQKQICQTLYAKMIEALEWKCYDVSYYCKLLASKHFLPFIAKLPEDPLACATTDMLQHIVEIFSERRADINKYNKNGETLLHALARLPADNCRLYPYIDELLSLYLTNPNIRDKSDKTPLDYARENYNNFLAKKLIEKGAKSSKIIESDVKTDNLITAELSKYEDSDISQRKTICHNIIWQININIEWGELDSVKEYCRKLPKEIILSYLNLSVHKNKELIGFLVNVFSERNPDYTKTNLQGQTLLHIFSKQKVDRGTISLINELLKNISDPNIKDKFDKTPVDYALENKGYFVLHSLLEFKAQLPATFATVDEKEWDQLIEGLYEYAHPVNYEYNNKIMSEYIKNQINPDIQLKFSNALFKYYETRLMCTESVDEITAFLKFLDLPQRGLNYNQEISMRLFLECFQRITDIDDQLKLIEAVLDPDSSIGKALLKTDSQSDLYSSKVGNFRKTLNAMKDQIMTEKLKISRS